MKLKIIRQDGSDGEVVIQYTTADPDISQHAIPGVDYVAAEGEVIFKNNENEKDIEIEILPKEEEDQGDRDDVFTVQLLQPTPQSGAKLSKKSIIYIEIVGNNEIMRKAKGIEEMIELMQQ